MYPGRKALEQVRTLSRTFNYRVIIIIFFKYFQKKDPLQEMSLEGECRKLKINYNIIIRSIYV